MIKAILILSLLFTITFSQNLVLNSSFEEITPTHWYSITWEGENPHFEFSETGKDSKKALLIHSEQETNSAVFTRVQVLPNTDYKLSGWIKTEDIEISNGQGASILLDFDQNKAVKFTATNSWTYTEFIFNSGNRDNINIYCILGIWGKAKGKAYFDNISLIPASVNKTNQNMEIKNISAEYPQIPLLINKTNNPAVRILIETTGSKSPLYLYQVFSTINKKSLTSLFSMRCFYQYLSPDFSDKSQFGFDISVQQEKICIAGNLKLKEGKNYLWLATQLSENAELSEKIIFTIDSIKTNDSMVHLSPPQRPTELRTGIAVRKHNDDAVDTYRIPAITTTDKGTLIAVFDIRRNNSKDLQDDIDVGMMRSTDKGRTWEPMKIIMDMKTWGNKSEEENGIGDPAILFDTKTNTLWAAASWHYGNKGKIAYHSSQPGMEPDETSQLILVKSTDDGKTWSNPINITSTVKNKKWKLLFQGPGRGITTSQGVLIFPAQYRDQNGISFSTILYSKDNGITWKLGKGAKSETTEAQVAELSNNRLMLNMRDNRGTFRSVAVTEDYGKTWHEHPSSRSQLIEPVCNAALLKISYKQKNYLLFMNPNSKTERNNMTIQISSDEGLTWNQEKHILLDEYSGFGYPSMTLVDDQHIGVLYESSQAHLVFQIIPMEDFFHE